ncbi:Asp-tRNA(Asn)/Glu-tRNA(Gln) amidotransferase subunit GatC [Peptoniphilus sp. oral taxon 386]|uniref:Asp-tRNA(Asn)/Glu-tRNA(Gln) amidotransferase subunit GatC n=1 Tax=Peptoniphilus sp. oral taxon 386 TaxID=652713 RepID=UPI0001DA9BE2|nr:Asp-tRNA(Asn)/Glu-tRNA(Gln) amidotransferase subunit GatC [Peptoniphilus sp. oral taxon 386]EFI42581.1 aspartyl/glutamyl-tRNA(Asn/Gln) amidotransferase, C subunit [Peptoniphilus sp. oral taxon 386 str. F0131]
MERSEIKHIADIAQIDFTDDELDKFQENFSETFELIDNIRKIDTENLETTFQVNDTVNNLREDEAHASLSQEDAIRNTLDEKYGYFKIIKFVE